MKTKENKDIRQLKKQNKKIITTKNEKGITLIALVITIIVLLILSAVTIATLTGENGILTKATDAREQNNIGQEKEEISIAYTGAVAENNGTGEVTAENLNAQFEKNGTSATASGEEPITVTFDSGRSYTIDSNGNITVSNISISMKIEGTKVTTPLMPTGFTHVDGSIDDGYIIQDGSGNQFVWVPVEKDQKIKINVTSKESMTSITLKDPYGDSIELSDTSNLGTSYSNENVTPTINGPYLLKVTTATEEKIFMLGVHSLYAVDTFGDWYATEEYAIAKGYESLVKFLEAKNYDTVEELMLSYGSNMENYSETEDYTDQVNSNGGFYIGRYEASYNGGNVASKPSTLTSTSNSTTLSNGMLWNYISQADALANTKNMYSIVSNKNFASSLLTGAAWDRTLGWLYETGEKTAVEIIGDSKSWGNYRNDTFTNTTSLVNTGAYSQTEANHIFDLAGNLFEWTTDVDDADLGVGRGGNYYHNGSFSPASDYNVVNPSTRHVRIGFRPALYLNS